jgi:mannose-6-phosphate isomerase-like protein (cupin superfamily)
MSSDPRDEVFRSVRPWGDFQQFTFNQESTVKVITVAPGQRLSLQRHQHRGEMWQILDASLEVTVGSDTWLAQAGELVWIPQGTTHRAANSAEDSVRLLEVAFGVFDEDDIERLEDDYRRAP